jgi:hypothetical protein
VPFLQRCCIYLAEIKNLLQGLKPVVFQAFTARLKSCPDTKPSFSAACKSVVLTWFFSSM